MHKVWVTFTWLDTWRTDRLFFNSVQLSHVSTNGSDVFSPDHLSPCFVQPRSKTLAPYSSDTDRRLKMGRRRPSKLGDSALPEEVELREQEEV